MICVAHHHALKLFWFVTFSLKLHISLWLNFYKMTPLFLDLSLFSLLCPLFSLLFAIFSLLSAFVSYLFLYLSLLCSLLSPLSLISSLLSSLCFLLFSLLCPISPLFSLLSAIFSLLSVSSLLSSLSPLRPSSLSLSLLTLMYHITWVGVGVSLCDKVSWKACGIFARLFSVLYFNITLGCFCFRLIP